MYIYHRGVYFTCAIDSRVFTYINMWSLLAFELDSNGTGAADVRRQKRKTLACPHQTRVVHHPQHPLGAAGRHYDNLRMVRGSYAPGPLGIILGTK